ncbi:MAG: bifunctional phosphoribosylaminoimidazolecarboxamide formyltransferase/IMP cyclohydrolase, partial [Bacteriovoracaceae bacterium]|nr:bifunctional phosphoribosylaminoimidazolecarboxamide formyltransferase/IMP cyclohydrolase [Bacteriovoracaceae bacterium]
MNLSQSNLKIKRALLSVSDKEGIEDLAKCLHDSGCEIISSGGTRKFIEELGIPVTAVESITGNPEAFDGRMKTLSFQISSSLLFRRGNENDEKQAKELGISPIDLVVCNL